VLGGLWLEIDEDEEREAESGAGSGNEDDRRGLGFGEAWENPREELLESEVLSVGGRGGREGDDDPGIRSRVSSCSGLKVEPDLEFDNDERGDECGNVNTPPLA
jgi:hypothetical protein